MYYLTDAAVKRFNVEDPESTLETVRSVTDSGAFAVDEVRQVVFVEHVDPAYDHHAHPGSPTGSPPAILSLSLDGQQQSTFIDYDFHGCSSLIVDVEDM